MEHHLDPALPRRRQHLEQMRPEGHVAPPAVKARVLALGGIVDHRHRLHPHHLVEPVTVEGLKQRRLERQHAAAVGRGPLGEEQQMVAGADALLEQRLLRLRLARVAADEDGAGRAREHADARPARHLGLRDEIDLLAGIEREDVEPGHMVRHHGADLGHRRAPDTVADAHQREDGAADGTGDVRRPGPRSAVQRPLDQPRQQQQRQPAIDHRGHRPAPAQHAQLAGKAQRRDIGFGLAMPGRAHGFASARRV
ncbi:hypothetical protein SDC9_38723 [bioreactor metagenome]|uniref:Uncharacterized protein n=1 Tax=bioreactor metagenome TaxID=1076179 RepID=A0A644VQ07_9ZZZZ